MERLRFSLITMAYKMLHNEEGISKQRDILNELEEALTAYNLSRDAAKEVYKKKNRLIKERNALPTLQIFRRKELTDEINQATAELQRYSEDQHELLWKMGCKTRKDIPQVEERIKKIKEYITYGKDVNAGFKAQIDDGSERFRKEKADIPTELSGKVRQERSYLRKYQRRELLYELQMDMKNYSYERYKQAEIAVDEALGDDAITAEERSEVMEQEQREAERRRAERQQKRRRKDMEL